MRGLFVTGTDTGAGKTVVAGAIVAALRARGERVAAFKPVVTGADEPPTAGWPPDHELLAAAAGVAARAVTPHVFGPPVSPHLAAELAGIAYASVAIVTLAYAASAFPEPLAGSGFLVPPVDRRLVKASTYSTNKWGWLRRASGETVIVRCSVGRHREVSDLQRDDADLGSLVAADFADATGVRGAPVDLRVTRWGGSLPQYGVGHLDRVARIRAAVAVQPGLAVCGAAYDGVGVAACIASAQRAVDEVMRALSARETMQP